MYFHSFLIFQFVLLPNISSSFLVDSSQLPIAKSKQKTNKKINHIETVLYEFDLKIRKKPTPKLHDYNTQLYRPQIQTMLRRDFGFKK